jgi:peptidylprolyl isomerase
VTLREIFVTIPGDASATVAQDTAAHEKATQIRQRALAGESFEKLAADLSDSPSRANAGLIGPLSMSDVSADLRKLIDPMKVGDITEVLHGAHGYQILKLESLSAAETRPFEQAREEISNRVFTTKRQGEFEKYLEKLRAEAIIEWKNQDLKKAYDEGVQQAKTSPSPALPASPTP